MTEKINDSIEQAHIELMELSPKVTGQSIKPSEFQGKRDIIMKKVRQEITNIIAGQMMNDEVKDFEDSLSKVMGTEVGKEAEKSEYPTPYEIMEKEKNNEGNGSETNT